MKLVACNMFHANSFLLNTQEKQLWFSLHLIRQGDYFVLLAMVTSTNKRRYWVYHVNTEFVAQCTHTAKELK